MGKDLTELVPVGNDYMICLYCSDGFAAMLYSDVFFLEMLLVFMGVLCLLSSLLKLMFLNQEKT